MKNLFREYKAGILWILCTVLVIAVCGIWVAVSHGNVPPEGQGSGGDLPGGSSGASSQSEPPVREPFATLDHMMMRLDYRETCLANLPETVSRLSPWQDCALYAAIRRGCGHMLALTFYRQDLTQADQERLMWFVHRYIESVCIDPAKTPEEEGYYLYPAEREEGYYIYSRELVSKIIEDVFGVEDYVIRHDAYDPEKEIYVVTDFGTGGIPPFEYIGEKDVVWVSDDAFDVTVTYYNDRETETADDWAFKEILHMKRSEKDPKAFYIANYEVIQPK